MKFTLLYVSPNKTTEKSVLELKNILEKDNKEVDLINIGAEKYRDNIDEIINKLNSSDIVGFASPVYHMRILEIMNEVLFKIEKTQLRFDFKVFFILTYAGITTGKAVQNFTDFFQKLNLDILGGVKLTAPHLHHQVQYPTEETIEYLNNFYKSIKNNDYEKLTNNRIIEISKPEKFITSLLYLLAPFVAKKRKLVIEVEADKCVACEKCINDCVAGAITLDETNGLCIDNEKCIHCYHCVIACKLNVFRASLSKLDKMIYLNKKIVGLEEPQNKILL